MSMPRAVRHINEIRVLETVFRHGKMSRASIARQLGLTRSTASSLVSGLVEEGLIIEDEIEDSRDVRTGRPGTLVRLNAHHAVFIGADIGVGRISIIAIDLEATVVAESHEKLDMANLQPAIIIEQLTRSVRAIMDRLSATYHIRSLCLTVPGIVDHDGMVLRAPILGWANIPVLQMVSAAIPEIPLLIAENDANAFAMAELYNAGADAPNSALYIFLDAGVGGAIISSGEILRGHDGYAGELGHIILGDEGFVDLATIPGSLESFIGRDAVLARYSFHGGIAKDLDEFIAAAERQESAATATLVDWAFYLGRALASLTSIFNPEKIVLGGPVSAIFKYCESDVLHSLNRHLLLGHPVPNIAVSSLGANGPAIGAASLLHKRILSVDENLVYRGSAGA
eukprot:gene14080-14198_t